MEDILEILRKQQGERFYSGSEKEDYFKELRGFFKLAQKSIKMIAVELDPLIYEDPGFLKICENALNHGVSIQIVFWVIKGENLNKEEALERLDVPSFVALKEGHPKLRFYWPTKRPEIPFAIVDGKHFLSVEPRCKDWQEPWHTFRREDSTLGADWQERFDSFIKEHCQEVQ